MAVRAIGNDDEEEKRMGNMNDIIVRKALKSDLDFLCEVFANARRFMIVMGNPDEWGEHYPDLKQTKADIAAGHCYIIEDDKNSVLGTFCVIEEDDPAYSGIRNGRWLNDDAYVVLTRVAATGYHGSTADAILSWCAGQYPNIRTETHRLNMSMRSALMRAGYKLCGVVEREGREPLLAFHKQPVVVKVQSDDDLAHEADEDIETEGAEV